MVSFSERKVPLLFSKGRTDLLGELTLGWRICTLPEYSYALLLFDQGKMAPQAGNTGFLHSHGMKGSCQAAPWSPELVVTILFFTDQPKIQSQH